MSSLLSSLKQVLLWSYPRGSWQYDLLCVLILLFIFLTPSRWFNPDPEPLHTHLAQPLQNLKNPAGQIDVNIGNGISVQDALKKNQATP